MNVYEFANFYKNSGYGTVCNNDGSFILVQNHRTGLVLPYEYVRVPERTLRLLCVRHGILAIRNVYPDHFAECNGGVYICETKGYGLHSLDTKARNQTRRGLEKCVVEVRKPILALEPYEKCLVDTFRRQERDDIHALRELKHLVIASNDCEDVVLYHVKVEEEVAAYCICAKVNGRVYILQQASRTEYLKYYTNNALTYHVTRDYINRDDIQCVDYGLKSIEETESLHKYKINMGYRLRAMKDITVLHPLVSMFLFCGGCQMIRMACKRHSKSDLLRKANALLLKKEKDVNKE